MCGRYVFSTRGTYGGAGRWPDLSRMSVVTKEMRRPRLNYTSFRNIRTAISPMPTINATMIAQIHHFDGSKSGGVFALCGKSSSRPVLNVSTGAGSSSAKCAMSKSGGESDASPVVKE